MPQQPTRRHTAHTRGDGARHRVLDAALDLLAERGWPGFTMEAVAERAHASKATVYRHWATRADLLVAAAEWVSAPLPACDTGDVVADMVAFTAELIAGVARPGFGQVLAAIADAAERDPVVARRHAELTSLRRRPLVDLVTAGVARGQLPEGTDVELLVDLVAGPIFYRRLVTHRPLDPAAARTLVTAALAGAGCAAADDEAAPPR